MHTGSGLLFFTVFSDCGIFRSIPLSSPESVLSPAVLSFLQTCFLLLFYIRFLFISSGKTEILPHSTGRSDPAHTFH